jgi:membrane protein
MKSRIQVIVISIGGLIFGEEAARGEVEQRLGALMGKQGSSAVQALLVSVTQSAQGAAFSVLGVLLLLVGATTVFGELQDALDRIWRVQGRVGASGWLTLVRARLLSFGMILAIGILLVVSLLASAVLALVSRWGEPIFGGWWTVAALGNAAGSFVLVVTMFALIYKIMPRARVQWNDVWIGALFTAILLNP